MGASIPVRARSIALALLVVTVGLAGCATDQEPSEASGPAALIETARAASAWLDTPEEALAAGYEPAPFCGDGEGVPWIKHAAVDTTIDPYVPEVVHFLPTTSNVSDPDHQRFVGVQYVAVTEGTEHNSSTNPPRVLGVPMDGPEPGGTPGEPWHATLHVFLADGATSDASFPSSLDAVECPPGTRPPNAPPPTPTSHDDRQASDARRFDDCQSVTDRTVHDHAELFVYLESSEPYDFSPERYQLTTQQLHIEGGQRDANGTIIHVHTARPTLDCFFDTIGWEVSSNTILTDEGEVYVENETHRLRVFVDGERSWNGVAEELHHETRYIVSFGKVDGSVRA